jgi:hypothetical protein
MALVSSEIHVSLDIGSKQHNVAIGLSSGELLDEFVKTNGVYHSCTGSRNIRE